MNVLSQFEKRNGTKVGINTGTGDATSDDEQLLLAQGSSSSSDEDFGTHEPSNSLLTSKVQET